MSKEKNFYSVSTWEEKIKNLNIYLLEVIYSSTHPLLVDRVRGIVFIPRHNSLQEKRAEWDNEGHCFINRYRQPQFDIKLS